MSLDIRIRTIPHSEQRYPTCGDWRTPEEGFSNTEITVSDLSDPRMEFAVAIHELIEMFLAQERGISAKAVTDFDEEYELNRQDGDESEPGDCPFCPVYEEHQFATTIERQLIRELRIPWHEYEDRINALFEQKADVPSATGD